MTPNNTKIRGIMGKFHQTASNARVFWANVVEIWDILLGRRPTLPDFGNILHTGPVVFEIPSLDRDMIRYSMYMYYSVGVEPLDTAAVLKNINTI